MNNYYVNYLMILRRKLNTNKNFFKKLSMIVGIFILISVLIDFLIPFNFLKLPIAIILGVLLHSFLYSYQYLKKINISNRFSDFNKFRLNTIVISFAFLFNILFLSPQSILYTFFFSWFFVILLFLWEINLKNN